MSRHNRRIFDDDDDDDGAGWTRSNSTRANGLSNRPRRNGTSHDPLTRVREVVEDNWRETLDDNFHPITLALDMLDGSSLGRAKDLNQFKETNKMIEQALQSTVNEHYQGFNASVGTYRQITGSIGQAQRQVRSTKSALLRAKVQLSSKRTDLMDMSVRSTQYQDMLKLLHDIAELKKVPDQLEAHLSAKHFLSAVELLNNATSSANRDDLLSITALGDTRQYFKSQGVAVVEILVEELHNHLYLKSPYSDSRWSTYKPGQLDLPIVTGDDQETSQNPENRQFSLLGRLPIDTFRAKELANESSFLISSDKHPESDSFQYIQMLAQALDAMGKLPYALDVMVQRIPYEVYQTVERTIGEIQLRHKNITTHIASHSEVLFRSEVEEDNSEPLRDLLWTLFSKWDAMLQCHCVLYESIVSSQGHFVEKHKNPRSSGVGYDFHDIWKSLESEIRSMLISYLTLHEDHNKKDILSNAADDMFSDRKTRAKTRGLFSIAHAVRPGDSAHSLEEQELREMLQGSVPGLLSEKHDQSSNLHSDKRDSLTTGHPQVSPATPFNISIFLQATLAFLQRAKRIIPDTPGIASSNISHFLDDFLDNIFDAQLSEAVDSAYRDSVGEHLEISSRSGMILDQSEVSLNEVRVLKIVTQVYRLLSSIPYQRDSYTDMILSIIRQYYSKSQSWLNTIVSNEAADIHLGSLMLGAAWASRQQIKVIWDKYYTNIDKLSSLGEATQAELSFIFEVKKGFVIRRQDLLQDPSKIEHLVVLNHSLNHAAKSLSELGNSSNEQERGLRISDLAKKHFDDLLSSFRDLARSILIILRMELRVHVLYFLQLALSQGNYKIEERANEVDTTILDLNADLMLFNNSLASLAPLDYMLVTDGLALLIDQVLIEDSSSISIMTLHGSEKLILGISALQQNLRNIIPDPEHADLSRASMFYAMFGLGPLGLCDRASDSARLGLTFAQASKLMTLMYSAELYKKDVRGNRDSLSARKRQLNESLSLLAAQMTSKDLL